MSIIMLVSMIFIQSVPILGKFFYSDSDIDWPQRLCRPRNREEILAL